MENCSDVLKRETVPDGYLDTYQTEIINRSAYGFTLHAAIDESFHDKSVVEPEEAFEHLKHLKPNTNNEFLLSKHF